MSRIEKLKGILAPVPTFIDETGDVDLQANLAACDRLLKTEIGGLFLFGTTGAFAYFSIQDRKKYIKFMCENLKSEKPVVYCVQHWNTKYALELTEYAIECGAEYLAALLPVYFSVAEDGIKKYYREIRSVIDQKKPDVPLYMYHIPILQSTAEIKPEIVKFDGGVFTGVNIMPNSYSRMINAAISGDFETYNKIEPVVSRIIETWSEDISYLPHVCKYAMKYEGYPVVDLPCSPLTIIGDDIKENVREAVDNAKGFWGSDDI